jgi:THO complex subunit 2
MRLFKCAGSLDVFWPLENNKTVTNTSAILEPEAIEYSGGVILDLGSSHKSVT